MRNVFILFLLIFCTAATQAGNEKFPAGGRETAMGNAAVALSGIWAVEHNQAGLAELKNIAAGIYYENKFLTKEMSLKSIAVVLPTSKKGVFAVNVQYFGYSLYNEQKAGFVYAKSFGNAITAGIQLNYLSSHLAENYGSRSAVAVEAGLQAQLTPQLRLGAHIYNPAHFRKASYEKEKIPTVMRLGFSYVFSDKVTVCAESEKDIDAKNILRAGIEYRIIKELFLRTGISSKAAQSTFGIGLLFKNFEIDMATSRHPILGYSPQISMVYNFK